MVRIPYDHVQRTMTTETEVQMFFHCTLSELAIERGLTKADIQSATGLSWNTVRKYWYNKPPLVNPNSEVVATLQVFFGLDTWYPLFKPHLTKVTTVREVHRIQDSENNSEPSK